MKIGNKRRTYLADTFAKTAEYIISLVILGQVVTGKINGIVLFFAILGCAVCILGGMFLIPGGEEE